MIDSWDATFNNNVLKQNIKEAVNKSVRWADCVSILASQVYGGQFSNSIYVEQKLGSFRPYLVLLFSCKEIFSQQENSPSCYIKYEIEGERARRTIAIRWRSHLHFCHRNWDH